MGPLPIEVKVFDAKGRGTSYISGGLAQTCEYAKKFNSAEACFIVYNVAEDTTLNLPGICTGPNIISIQLETVNIHSITIDLCRTLSASHAKKLKRIDIKPL
jgi:hypothetical protein